MVLFAEGRHLQDTENRLRTNISEQKSLNEAAIHADLDQKAKKLDEKVKVKSRTTHSNPYYPAPIYNPSPSAAMPLAIHTNLDQNATNKGKKID